MERLSQLVDKHHDVLVVGGGINGAAVAHMAVVNGFKVALLEKSDFASGTSSKSSKLMHGGLRYLETCEFGLVKESLKERFIQLRNAPHLVHPLPFIIPVYKSDPRPLWLIKLGVFVYDFLSGPYLIKKHQSLSAEEVCQRIPEIKTEGLCGGILYYDAQMDDAQLCLEHVKKAVEKGAYAAHHVEVKDVVLERGRAVGVKAYNILEQKEFEVRASKIVCAVGPWTNTFLEKEQMPAKTKVRMTKGVHIVCQGQVAQEAVLLQTQTRGRIFFIIPWKGNTLIGTTDTDFTGSPDDVRVEEQDVRYLLEETGRFFKEGCFSKDHIMESFAGLRPLVYHKGEPFKVSRKHIIEESSSGIIYVMGGKYTIYRKMAEDAMGFITKKRVQNTDLRLCSRG